MPDDSRKYAGSDLIAVEPPSTLEAVKPSSDPIAYYPQYHQQQGYNYYQQGHMYQPVPPHGGYMQQNPPKEKKILGLRPVTFWLALASAILLIGVMVAAAMAGVAVTKNNTLYVELSLLRQCHYCAN
jgi:hypothetical protein